MAEENNAFNGKVEEIKEDVKEAIQEVKEEFKEFQDKVEDKIEDIKEDFAEGKEDREAKREEFKAKAEDVKEDAKEAFDKAKEKAQEKIDQIKAEVDDYSDEMDPEDVNNNKIMAIISYIGILVLIPIFAAKNSKFVKFHANQGLVLFLIALVVSALSRLKVIGWLFGIVDVVIVILAVVGIVYAAQGKAKELPVIGNWKLLN